MSGEDTRQHGRASQPQQGPASALKPIPLSDTMHNQPGILMFTRGQKLLRTNRRALELIRQLDQGECAPGCEIHSAPVCDLRNAIQAALDHRRAANIWEPFELKHIVFQARRRVLIRGLGLADRTSHDDSLIVIVLKELDRQHEPSVPQKQAMGHSREGGGVTILGSAQLGSDRGVFDVRMHGAY